MKVLSGKCCLRQREGLHVTPESHQSNTGLFTPPSCSHVPEMAETEALSVCQVSGEVPNLKRMLQLTSLLHHFWGYLSLSTDSESKHKVSALFDRRSPNFDLPQCYSCFSGVAQSLQQEFFSKMFDFKGFFMVLCFLSEKSSSSTFNLHGGLGPGFIRFMSKSILIQFQKLSDCLVPRSSKWKTPNFFFYFLL